MTDSTIDWDVIDVDEEISESEQQQSNDLDITTPAGQYKFEVVSCDAVEKTFNKYSCIAAKLKMKITGILKIEQPLIDDKGQPVKRNGEVVKKVQLVKKSNRDKVDALYIGRFIFDEINLYNPAEKEAMKNRRLFVAKRLGIISPVSTVLPTSAWKNASGCTGIVETENNSWEKDGELKSNVKVKWSGYDFIKQSDAKNAKAAQADNDTEAFDI